MQRPQQQALLRNALRRIGHGRGPYSNKDKARRHRLTSGARKTEPVIAYSRRKPRG